MVRHKARPAAWARAVDVHAHLSAGGSLRAVGLPDAVRTALPCGSGEYPVAWFSGGMTFARHSGAVVRYGAGGPALIAGSQQFVTGYLLGSLVMASRRHHQALRAAAPQWRPAHLLQTVVTTGRLWCQVAEANRLRWVHFGYDGISHLAIEGEALVLRFYDAEDLRLAGQDAPWCAAVIAHFRYGPCAAPAMLPALRKATLAS